MSVQAIKLSFIYFYSVLFQYILCVGSSGVENAINFIKEGFNTSYVSVQDILKKLKKIAVLGFNTSYVSVQACLFRCK